MDCCITVDKAVCRHRDKEALDEDTKSVVKSEVLSKRQLTQQTCRKH